MCQNDKMLVCDSAAWTESDCVSDHHDDVQYIYWSAEFFICVTAEIETLVYHVYQMFHHSKSFHQFLYLSWY